MKGPCDYKGCKTLSSLNSFVLEELELAAAESLTLDLCYEHYTLIQKASRWKYHLSVELVKWPEEVK
jgi:hypothetical protein